MKLLLVGNHTCGNRGDSAILRGLIVGLRDLNKNLEITAISRFPVSSSYLLNEELLNDDLYSFNRVNQGVIHRIKKILGLKYSTKKLYRCVKNNRINKLPNHIKQHVEFLKKYDAVIHVGGSFFVDLYGIEQFEHALCTILAKKPLYLVGHSVGPFNGKLFCEISNFVFSKANKVFLREKISLDIMKSSNIFHENIEIGTDTAWLVQSKNVGNSKVPIELNSWLKNKKTIAVTFRKLAPFDKYLNISQSDYEKGFSDFINKVIKNGYQVLAISTCTGIDSYHRDDRMIALSIGKNIKNTGDYRVLMDEYNDEELGTIFSNCYFTVGTRLHSAIISNNYGTPSIALNYEHKSKGIMQSLELEKLSLPVNSLFDDSLYSSFVDFENNDLQVSKTVVEQVNKEKHKGKVMLESLLNDIKCNL